MVKYTIDQPVQPVEEDEAPIRLTAFLEQTDEGIYLAVREDDDTPWSIIGLTNDGYLVRCSSVSTQTGLKVDKDGRVRIKKGTF